jgi:hypothetical protein
MPMCIARTAFTGALTLFACRRATLLPCLCGLWSRPLDMSKCASGAGFKTNVCFVLGQAG